MSEYGLEIEQEALAWEGTPYKHMGRDRQGVDCIGLPIVVGWAKGYTGYDIREYSRRPEPNFFLREVRKLPFMTRIPKDKFARGDLGIFVEPRHPCHVGLISWSNKEDDYQVIHAYALARKVIIEPMTRTRLDRLIMVFRYVGNN